MHLLGITSRLPYPLTDGAKICMYRIIKGLSELGHTVDIVAIDEIDIDVKYMDSYCKIYKVLEKPISRDIGALLTLFSKNPYTQIKKNHKSAYTLIDSLVKKNNYSAVYSDQSHVAQYGSYVKKKYNIPFVLRFHNMEHEIYERVAKNEKNILFKNYLIQQSKKWKRFEIEQATLADASATITERDKITLQNYVPNAVVNTVTASIDLNDFPYSSIENRKQNTLLMIGSDMNWAPNKDSVVWFVNKILPLILKDSPDTIFYLVGDNPPLDELPLPNKNFVMLGKNSNIKELYSTISVGIVPLRLGGGMRIKILEMMSAGMPFVSTSIGAEGNFAAPNEHYLLGNTEIEFAKSTIQLLKSKELQNKLSINSNEFVHKNYSDKSTIKVFEELLTNAVLNFNKNVKN